MTEFKKKNERLAHIFFFVTTYLNNVYVFLNVFLNINRKKKVYRKLIQTIV